MGVLDKLKIVALAPKVKVSVEHDELLPDHWTDFRLV